MRKLTVVLIVLLMSLPVYGQSKGGGNKGHQSSPNERSGPVGSFRNQSVYDNSGRLQQTIKRDSSGNQNVYDNHGRLQQTIKRDSSGAENVSDDHGRLEGYVKPNGPIMNR